MESVLIYVSVRQPLPYSATKFDGSEGVLYIYIAARVVVLQEPVVAG